MITNIENCIVIVASQKGDSNYSTHGTGFLISKENKTYVLTCRHVARQIENDSVQFIIHNPKKSSNVSGAFKISSPLYYNYQEPYIDICLMEIVGYTASMLHNQGVDTISVNKFNPNVEIGESIIVSGYSGDYFLENISKNNPHERMFPQTFLGTITDINITESSFIPNNDNFKETYDCLQCKLAVTKWRFNEGISGSPVIKANSREICGVLYAGSYNPPEFPNMSILLFTPISFLIDLLNRRV